MPRVLLIGYDPDSVDFSDPSLPPDLNADKIRAGITAGLRRIKDRGWGAEFCSIQPDDTAVSEVERALSAATYDCIVIGGGVRMPPTSVPRLEAIIDVIRRTAPQAPIAFNTGPEDSLEAAARWIERT